MSQTALLIIPNMLFLLMVLISVGQDPGNYPWFLPLKLSNPVYSTSYMSPEFISLSVSPVTIIPNYYLSLSVPAWLVSWLPSVFLTHIPLCSCQLSFQNAILMSVSSVVLSCPTLCDPTDCSTPGFPALANLSNLFLFIPLLHVLHQAFPDKHAPISFAWETVHSHQHSPA